MKVKVGDTVKVIAGADKGKEGKILKTYKSENRVIVAGVHMIKKHVKPGRTNETGGILEIEAPIHASNVKVLESGKKESKKAVKEVKVNKADSKKEKAPLKKATAKKTTSVEKEGETGE